MSARTASQREAFAQLDGRAERAIAKRERLAEVERDNDLLERTIRRSTEAGYRSAVRAYRWMIGYGLVIGFVAGYVAGVVL